ncbi:MAG: serine hydrolase, partial [Draconibacterium sp.]|nr:serine hydrolase [Draconibacterium sp.]
MFLIITKMKKGIRTILLFVFLFGFTNCEMEKSNIVYNKQYIDEIKAVKKVFTFYLLGNNIPGGTVAVMKDGKIIYSEGIGLASKDLDVPVTRETKFRIGQLSELFTSFIYLRMVEEGILNSDSLVQHYFSDFPEKEFPITLRQLADQTSGLRDARNKELNWDGLNVSILKGIDNFKNDTLFYMPGFVQTDCMFHYNLLGAIMEKATKKNFNKILKDYVTDTLELANTEIDNPFVTIKGRTNFYDHSFISQTVNATF